MNSIGNIINQNRRQLLWKALLGIGGAVAGSTSLLPSQLNAAPAGQGAAAPRLAGIGRTDLIQDDLSSPDARPFRRSLQFPRERRRPGIPIPAKRLPTWSKARSNTRSMAGRR